MRNFTLLLIAAFMCSWSFGQIKVLPNGNIYMNTTGNQGMATAGSGDVLTGILLGLLSKGYTPENAAKSGVYLHGLAGDYALEKQSYESLIASDIIEHFGLAFRFLACAASEK